MIRQAAGGREELLKGRPLGNFALLGLPAVTAGIQVLVKEGSDIEFVKGIGFGLLWNFFGFRFQEGLIAVIVGLGGFLVLLFKDRIGNHLLVDHFAQLEAIQRQDAHHLYQAWRQNLFLRDAEIELDRKSVV